MTDFPKTIFEAYAEGKTTRRQFLDQFGAWQEERGTGRKGAPESGEARRATAAMERARRARKGGFDSRPFR